MCEALQTLQSRDSSLILTASCGERRAGIVAPNGYVKKQSLTVWPKVTQPLSDRTRLSQDCPEWSSSTVQKPSVLWFLSVISSLRQEASYKTGISDYRSLWKEEREDLI